MSIEEQSPNKRPKIESDNRAVLGDLFYEGDSDEEPQVYPQVYDDAPYHAFEKERRCVDSHLCHRYQHRTDFEGLPFFEIFKVKVKLNKNYGSTPINDARLCGEIVTVPDPNYVEYNPQPISYYSASHDRPDRISLNADSDFVLLPISSPIPRPVICRNRTLALDFAFKMNDVDMYTRYGFRRENPRLFGNDGCAVEPMYVRGFFDRGTRKTGHGIERTVIGLDSRDHGFSGDSLDPVIMEVYHNLYEGAWATIDVQMLKDGVRDFYGLIVARPCVFSKRFRLLTIQRGVDNKVTIERGGDGEVNERTRSIKLTRSVVTVPSYASLVIGALLYGNDGKPFCDGKVAFPARESAGQESSIISYNGVETLRVTVEWRTDV